ncbi:glycine betaine ABC transporter substrate-binding protein [Vallitalea okinawensis]|uniref:glycine betaine ABC transporter substrate-binding protein n=1 Tax=Vallitalea okinawensis TaxID=2078660 RepID=UPI001FA90794|nr:glycine betaine ABC transporter substrate-binding protein [Vallitalea okinawensis]
MRRNIIIMFISIIMLLSLVACGKDEKKVVVASKPHAEQYILAEMITQLIETHTDIQVEQKLGIGGGTANIHPAMEKGEIDIYPEYTGTGWLFVLKEELINDPEQLYVEVKAKYMEDYNIQWLDLYGFNNTYALALKKPLADELGISTYSELALKGNGLNFGAEYDFYEREDGYPGLENVYGLEFEDKIELDIGLKYEAIASNEVDVINVFSTDGLLKKYELTVLEDDKNFFPAYQPSTLIRSETLKEYPELEEVLNMLAGQISDEEMIQLNYLVEKENKDPKDVAKEFLVEKGLI